jgi:1,2-phenylacetyl-CoA epoxidase PaaB subunit
VIEAIHARQPILPAKFGSVYAHAEDIVSALRFARDTLLPQLRRLEGCDEWAVHLYAEAAVVREKVTREDPAIRRLRDERGAARPGRAYFLEQKLLDELKAATEQALVTLAQDVFERLAGYAVGRQVNKVRSVDQSADELEILSASFLVSRTRVERFKEEARSCADTGDGLRCEYSGPWPPYSFAVGDEGNAR